MAQQVDKKKMAILALLGASLLGVGVWQFTGSAPEEAKFSEPEKAENNQANNEEVVAPPTGDLLAGLTRKDPFVPGHLPGEPTGLPVQPNRPVVNSSPTPPRPSGGGLRPWGGLAPLSGVGGSVTTEPSTAMQPTQPTGEFELVGVVDGPHPVAVFRSASGTQKMVYLSGSVSQGVRVTKISHGHVTVSQNGKTKTLTVGGNSQ